MEICDHCGSEADSLRCVEFDRICMDCLGATRDIRKLRRLIDFKAVVGGSVLACLLIGYLILLNAM